MSNLILPLVVRTLRDEHPGCDIRLFEEETDRPEVHELDLMFFDGRVDGDVEHLKLLDDPYLVLPQLAVHSAGVSSDLPAVAGRSHPLATRGTCDRDRRGRHRQDRQAIVSQ